LLYAGEESGSTVSEKDWAALVLRVARRDQNALHALYVRTHRMVYTVIVRMVQNRETAEELTLDVFHDVWRRAVTYDPVHGTVIGWIMNQARSRAIDRLRFDQRKKRNDANPDSVGEAPFRPGPQEGLEQQQQGTQLRNALAVLTLHERQAIEAAYFAGLTYAEVAARLDEPLGTVKTRIRSGLSKLRDALDRT
jgi:RNA polymerase sigma-70 factor (ECF subfamily)